MLKTHEGAQAYEHSLNHALELFSKGGSLFKKRGSFYSGDESALSLFQKSWIVDKELTFKLLLWLRDCRGGAGNRSGFRDCLHWLAGIACWQPATFVPRSRKRALPSYTLSYPPQSPPRARSCLHASLA